MRRLLLPLLVLAGCGAEEEEPCAHATQRFLFDGAETSGRCTSATLNVHVLQNSVNGDFSAGVHAGQPEVALWFRVPRALPGSFELDTEGVADPEAWPWAKGMLRHVDATGPLRATTGTARLVPSPGGITMEVEGRIARRDGVERPFTARLESVLDVVCSCWGGSCAPAEQAICAEYIALATPGPRAER